jgi:hypothetical protein
MWADRITVRKRFGCSPFFALTGAHPVLPFDIMQATWLMQIPGHILSTTELIGLRARALALHSEHVKDIMNSIDAEKRRNTLRYEKMHAHTIKSFDFKPGDLVLVRNSQVEKSLNAKMQPRWWGPCIIIRKTMGGAYVIAEMNGAVFQNKISPFRVRPYNARHKVSLPKNLSTFTELTPVELENIVAGPDPSDKDISFIESNSNPEKDIIEVEYEDDYSIIEPRIRGELGENLDQDPDEDFSDGEE